MLTGQRGPEGGVASARGEQRVGYKPALSRIECHSFSTMTSSSNPKPAGMGTENCRCSCGCTREGAQLMGLDGQTYWLPFCWECIEMHTSWN